MNHLMNPLPYKENSILFAPMEGITDAPYRLAIAKEFPQWDHHFSDFLRIPTNSTYSKEFIIEHFGAEVFNTPNFYQKTTLQILTTPIAQTQSNLKNICELGFKSIDLNIGCPSKKVNGSRGGAYLLKDTKELAQVVSTIRKLYPHCFTVKIRIGYHDDSNFLESLKVFENEGVDAVTIHGRTRDQLYKGVADWNYIGQAVDYLKIPVIGNGDIWDLADIAAIKAKTNCHSIMIGRGAQKTPWLAKLYKEGLHHPQDSQQLLATRKQNIIHYFHSLEKEYRQTFPTEEQLLKRFKAFCRYLFEDFANGQTIKKNILRTKSLIHFKENLYNIDETAYHD